jgi:hypothetical protein
MVHVGHHAGKSHNQSCPRNRDKITGVVTFLVTTPSAFGGPNTTPTNDRVPLTYDNQTRKNRIRRNKRAWRADDRLVRIQNHLS